MKNRSSEIIKIYKNYYLKNPDKIIANAKEQKNLVNAIEVAALSIDKNGNKHSHQYRIPNLVLKEWADILIQNNKKIGNAKTFDELLNILKELTIKGIGELSVYDCATRIGAYLKLFPEKIYLHAGTRTGAFRLLGKISGDYIEKNQLPASFRRDDLSCAEIEDILCIFKDELDSSISQEIFKSKCLKKNKEKKSCNT